MCAAFFSASSTFSRDSPMPTSNATSPSRASVTAGRGSSSTRPGAAQEPVVFEARNALTNGEPRHGMIIAMPSAEMVLVFMAAALALNLTPGPDMLYVTARSISDGRAAGVLSAFGIAAGTLVHITALALGLAALLATVPLAYDVVRIAGATYLVVIGLQLLLRPLPVSDVAGLPPLRLRAVFAR